MAFLESGEFLSGQTVLVLFGFKGREMKRLIFAFCIGLIAALDVSAAGCGKGRTIDVFRAKENSGYVFHVYRPTVDISFLIPGSAFSADKNKGAAIAAFQLDGMYYQIVFSDFGEFSNSTARMSAAEILDAHAKWEYDHAMKMGGPLNVFKDFGNRVRPASDGTPELTFKVWSLNGKQQEQLISQYFLTTVIGSEVAVISGIPLSRAGDKDFFTVANRIASTLGHLSAEFCAKNGG